MLPHKLYVPDLGALLGMVGGDLPADFKALPARIFDFPAPIRHHTKVTSPLPAPRSCLWTLTILMTRPGWPGPPQQPFGGLYSPVSSLTQVWQVVMSTVPFQQGHLCLWARASGRQVRSTCRPRT